MISSSPRDQRKISPRRRISCAADAVPLPLDQPLVRAAELVRRLLERRGEEERIGARAIVVRRRALGDQRPVGTPRSAASCPSGGGSASPAAGPRPRPARAPPGGCETPTRKRAGQQLVEHEQLGRAAAPATSRSPRRTAARPTGRAAAGCAPPASGAAAGRRRSSARACSSSSRVTVSALSPTAACASTTSHSGRPVKRSAHSRSIRPEISRGEPLPGQEEDRPGGVLGRHRAQVRGDRLDLGVGPGGGVERLVELAEASHR